MTERPILFSAPMVRAILAGRKTQTRRIVKPQPPRPEDFPHSGGFGLEREVADSVGRCYSLNDYERLQKHPTDWRLTGSVGVARDAGFGDRYRCPFGAPGDRLWVRETFGVATGNGHRAVYRADLGTERWPATLETAGAKFKPSIHMPRELSRITLEVTGVRVERLQAITEADARAEGLSAITKDGHLVKWGIPDRDGLPGTDNDGWPWAEWDKDPRVAFQRLWERINGAEAWAANPWVWVVDFRRVDAEVAPAEVAS